jgi:hypothetical protein
MKQDVVTLQTLCEGKAELIFQRDLAKLLENIVDEKIPADVPREMILRIRFAPGKDRKNASVLFESKLKLAQGEAAGGLVHIQRRSDKVLAFPEATLGFTTIGEKENK